MREVRGLRAACSAASSWKLGFANLHSLRPVRVGDALRVASHPDHARDEPDRQRREARFKQVGAALELLSGIRKAAAA